MNNSDNLLLLESGVSTDSKKTNTGNKGNTGYTGNKPNSKDLKKINKKVASEIFRYINLQRSLHLLQFGKFLTIPQ